MRIFSLGTRWYALCQNRPVEDALLGRHGIAASGRIFRQRYRLLALGPVASDRPGVLHTPGRLARGREGQRCGSGSSLGLLPACMEQVLAGPAGGVAPWAFAEWDQQLLSPACNGRALGFAALWVRRCFPKRGAPRHCPAVGHPQPPLSRLTAGWKSVSSGHSL